MTNEAMATGMRNVDHTGAPDFFVRYLDTMSAQAPMQALKRRSFALLAVHPGAHLLDVGCGPGDDVRALAQLVGRTGRVVGVDQSATMIAAARTRAAGAPLSVAYQVGDAQHLAFADESFDGCRAERVLMHVAHPQHALAEMIRVTRRGGRLVVLDPDFETLVVGAADQRVTRRGGRLVVLDPDFETLVVGAADQRVTRRILNFLCDRIVRHGWSGRQCPALFRAAQLTEIQVAAETVLYTEYPRTAHLWMVVLRSDATSASWPWGDCRTPVCSTQPWVCAAHHLCATSGLSRSLLGHLPSSLLHFAPGRESVGRPPSQHARNSSQGGQQWILPPPSNFCVRMKMRSSRRGGAMGACKCRR